ncbi:hypothetical protein ig2599ANME_0329, partial [groundwater metagenome]
YSFENAWKQILLGLNRNLYSQHGKGVNMELDFSLKEAIEMNIVKLPLKGMVIHES